MRHMEAIQINQDVLGDNLILSTVLILNKISPTIQ